MIVKVTESVSPPGRKEQQKNKQNIAPKDETMESPLMQKMRGPKELPLLLSHVSRVRPHRRQPTRLPAPGILQARTLEWVAVSFSSA